MNEDSPRSGRCAIVGRPNVGKSTLLNTLLGQKLAIATPKPQTTRTTLLGIYSSETPPTQIAFVDTPGLHRPENALGRAIVERAKGSLPDSDVVVMVIALDPKKRTEDVLLGADGEVLEIVREANLPVVLALNKVDQIKDKARLLPILSRCTERYPFAAVVPISARRGSGLPGLIREIRALLPEGLQYDPDQLTDRPERFFVSELAREAVIRHTRQELPYTVAVLVDEFEEDGGLTRIALTMVVEKDSHKGILIGKSGERLKLIGSEARAEMETLLERKVFLKLWVKVVPGWTRDPNRVRELTSADGDAS
jgi:GTP-binding protein Era